MMQRNCSSGNEDNNNNTSTHQACASCKHQRKRCNSDCVLAPYFPAYKTKEFQAVHKVFGVSNVQKMVRTVREEDRTKLTESLTWEALWRQKDSVLGSYGEYRRICEELKLYKGIVHHHQHLINWGNHHHVLTNNNKTGLLVDYASGSAGFSIINNNNNNNNYNINHNDNNNNNNNGGVNRGDQNGGYSSRNLHGGWEKFKQERQQCYAVINGLKQHYSLSDQF